MDLASGQQVQCLWAVGFQVLFAFFSASIQLASSETWLGSFSNLARNCSLCYHVQSENPLK
jgi:hypothetical protein